MKRIIIIVIIIALLAGGWYAYKAYTGKVPSLTEVKAEASVSAENLILAFEKDSATANKQYLGKIIEVTGTVKGVEKESGTVVLGSGTGMSSVRCSLDSTFVKNIASLNEGTKTVIKGACTGYNADDLGLGSDVVLNRCVIVSDTNK